MILCFGVSFSYERALYTMFLGTTEFQESINLSNKASCWRSIREQLTQPRLTTRSPDCTGILLCSSWVMSKISKNPKTSRMGSSVGVQWPDTCKSHFQQELLNFFLLSSIFDLIDYIIQVISWFICINIIRHSPQAPLLGFVAKITSLNLSPSKSLYGGYVSLIFCTNWVTWSSATRDTVHPPHPAPTGNSTISHCSLVIPLGDGLQTHRLIGYHMLRLLYTIS